MCCRKAMMKLCLISTDYPSPGLPTFTFVEQLVNNLIMLDVDVTVIAPQSITHALIHRKSLRPRKSEVISSCGKKYDVYRPFTLSIGNYSGFGSDIFMWTQKVAVKHIVKHINPDVLYCHFWENACLVSDYARQKQYPLFVACGEGDNALEDLIERISVEAKEKLASAVNGVICVSTENKRKCIKFGLCREKNVVVLPNCVETDLFKFGYSLDKRKELNINDGDFVIAFCGAFIERKGSNRLSDAIDKLNDPSIKSIFIGKPFDGKDMTPKCEGIVHMGALSHEKLPEYLNCADIFVLPTQKEGCCNAIVEALACGLPVISSDGAFNDDILDIHNSIRVNPNDVDAIADAIKRLKDNKDLRGHMRDYSIDNHETYSLSNRAERILSFINDHI